MTQVNIHEAKTHLSQLLSCAALREDIIIAKPWKPIVRLVPVEEPSQDRILGQDEGLFAVPEDFNNALFMSFRFIIKILLIAFQLLQRSPVFFDECRRTISQL